MTKRYRMTNETEISIEMGPQLATGKIDSGVPFFDHMLSAMLFRADIVAVVDCKGDLLVGTHHTLEDIGITMGEAIREAYARMEGFVRYACITVPMDDALVRVAIDISGRPYFLMEGVPVDQMNELEQSCIEFLRAFSINAKMTVHIDVLRGFNRHHILEATFKAFGGGLGEALTRQKTLASTKGVIA